jgi:hypothetical protein
MDSVGNTYLLAGAPNKWVVGASYEVVASVAGKAVPLYYNPLSTGGTKYPVVDAFLGDKTGPESAEVTGENELTVIFRGSPGSSLSFPVGYILISKFSLDSGTEYSRYNFDTKKFDAITTNQNFWSASGGVGSGITGKRGGDPYKGTYLLGPYKDSSYSGVSPELTRLVNDTYQQALTDFDNVINPGNSVTGSSQSGGSIKETTNAVDSITGTSRRKDIFSFDAVPGFGEQKDSITNFSTKDKDSLQFSKSAFGVSTGKFAIAKKAKDLSKVLATDANFVYNQQKGELIFNANSTQPGFGDDGGVFAVLVGHPKLLSSSVSFM